MKTVLDFQRESMPITFHDIHVPFLPQVHDMIMMKGDDPDPWLAKVLTIQERSKTAKVWYYMENVLRPGEQLYVPYRDVRQAQDVVPWDSILRAAIGEWRGDAWFMGLGGFWKTFFSFNLLKKINLIWPHYCLCFDNKL